MYRLLGKSVVRLWPLLLCGWIAALLLVKQAAPPWQDVIKEGEFAFLPPEMPSLEGERIYEEAWGDPFASQIVVVVRRDRIPLDEGDRGFITSVLKPRLTAVLEEIGLPEPSATDESARPVTSRPGGQKPTVETNGKGDAATAEDAAVDQAVAEEEVAEEDMAQKIKTFASPGWQKILDSSNGTATMVVIDLRTEFFNARNTALIDRIEELIAPSGPLYQPPGDAESLVPGGLHLALSGSATVGRDMMVAATESSKATEKWTVILVILLLIGIYRAPVLALIPLLTVAIATEFSLGLLAVLADYDIVSLFNGIEVYVKILSYGAGVDYCLFLIARFKEELDELQDPQAAVTASIANVGEALVASAATVICGIGMMVFADFGKFRQAGVGITIGLIVVLIASLTFTPALLRLTGRWAFWPHVATRSNQTSGGWVSATGLMASLLRRNVFETIWQKVSEIILARPGYTLVLSTALMLPFAVIAVTCFDNLSYGLLSELPQDNTSVLGARAVQSHYPAGTAGPATLLLHHPQMDFTDSEHQEYLKLLVNRLYERREQLKLADIRSVVHPFGIAVARAEEAEQARPAEVDPDAAASDDGNVDNAASSGGGGIFNNILNRSMDLAENRIESLKVGEYYVGRFGQYEGTLTRIDFVSTDDPFSRDGIRQFVELRDFVLLVSREALDDWNRENIARVKEDLGDISQEELMAEVGEIPESSAITLSAMGPTASIRDLKTVTDRDQRVVDSLVLAGVFGILLVLLRHFTVCAYLIVSVFFSYLVTLGVTFAMFWSLDPHGFTGLDWKVPTFLFTILIAVGEDYNIFLMTRIREEQIRHGAIDGVAVALRKTGSIISSCGVIMAGTFSSLLAGSLAGMHQLGFALAFGVLLDTFVVRPILVPAFLVLMYQRRLPWQMAAVQNAAQYDADTAASGLDAVVVEISEAAAQPSETASADGAETGRETTGGPHTHRHLNAGGEAAASVRRQSEARR